MKRRDLSGPFSTPIRLTPAEIEAERKQALEDLGTMRHRMADDIDRLQAMRNIAGIGSPAMGTGTMFLETAYQWLGNALFEAIEYDEDDD